MHRIATYVRVVAVVATLVPAAAVAQAPPPLDRPDLRRYVAEVLTRNAARGAAFLDLEAATERIAPAGALPDPVVEFGMRSVPIPSFDFAQEAMTQLPIGVRQNFPGLGKQAARTEVARQDSALAAAGTGRVDADLVVRAAGAFFRLAYTQSAVELWQARIDLADQAVITARARYATGAAPQSDLLRAELRRADLIERAFELASALEETRADLDALRGGSGDPVPSVDLTDPSSAAVVGVTRDTLGDSGQLEVELEIGNPDLRVARARVERARSEARVFAIAGRPDFFVALQNGIRFGGREPFLSATAGLSVPLWAGRKQAPAARAADRALEAEQGRYKDLAARLRGELLARIARLRALGSQVGELGREVLPRASAASESTLSAYATGATELSAVLDAQDDFVQARLRLARLVMDYAAERAALSALLGEEWYR